MIPKQYFMIWIGDTIPNWASTANDAFHYFNFDFEQIFIHITDFVFDKESIKFTQVHYNADLLANRGISLNKTLNNLNKNLKCPNSFIRWKYNQNISMMKDPNYKVIFSDLLRFQLLHDWGGIYIDCDAVPRKPFDNKVLNRKQFFTASYHGGIRVVRDNFFLGSEPGRWINFSYWRVLLGDMCYPIDFDKNKDSDRAKRFFDGKLHISECNEDNSINKHGYIDHFFKRSWD